MADLSKKLPAVQDILKRIFEELRSEGRNVLKEIERVSNIYQTGSIRREFENIDPDIYALYFMPEHLPKILIVLYELIERYSLYFEKIKKVYDLGSGVGTASLGLNLLSDKNLPVVLVDRSPKMLKTSYKILSRLGFNNFEQSEINYLKTDIVSDTPSMYIFMNTLSENIDRIEGLQKLIDRILRQNRDNIIIIIEPLSEKGRNIVVNLRERYWGSILMPCTNSGECPLIKSDCDICRFAIDQKISEKLEVIVTAGHRLAKFYYLVLSASGKDSQERQFRILNYPVSRKYGFDLKICNQQAISFLRIKTKGNTEKKITRHLIPNGLIELRNLNNIEFEKPHPLSMLNIKTVNDPSLIVNPEEHTVHS